jgi:hypothetical protein
MVWACATCGRKVPTGVLCVNLKEGNQLEDLGVDGVIIGWEGVKCI